jgi:hypothetical protein
VNTTPDLTVDIRLGRKELANTLAYNTEVLTTVVKSFIAKPAELVYF